jgi:hypothetical protein
MMHEIYKEENKNNKNFVNLHAVDRRRRFNDIGNVNVLKEREEARPRGMTIEPPARKILRISQRKVVDDLIKDDEIERVLSDVGQLKTREDIKFYLKNKISEIIGKLDILFY